MMLTNYDRDVLNNLVTRSNGDEKEVLERLWNIDAELEKAKAKIKQLKDEVTLHETTPLLGGIGWRK